MSFFTLKQESSEGFYYLLEDNGQRRRFKKTLSLQPSEWGLLDSVDANCPEHINDKIRWLATDTADRVAEASLVWVENIRHELKEMERTNTYHGVSTIAPDKIVEACRGAMEAFVFDEQLRKPDALNCAVMKDEIHEIAEQLARPIDSCQAALELGFGYGAEVSNGAFGKSVNCYSSLDLKQLFPKFEYLEAGDARAGFFVRSLKRVMENLFNRYALR